MADSTLLASAGIATSGVFRSVVRCPPTHPSSVAATCGNVEVALGSRIELWAVGGAGAAPASVPVPVPVPAGRTMRVSLPSPRGLPLP